MRDNRRDIIIQLGRTWIASAAVAVLGLLALLYGEGFQGREL